MVKQSKANQLAVPILRFSAVLRGRLSLSGRNVSGNRKLATPGAVASACVLIPVSSSGGWSLLGDDQCQRGIGASAPATVAA
jgi:hypothetical protein